MIDHTKVQAAIEALQEANAPLTLQSIAKASGHKYADLYASRRYAHYVKSRPRKKKVPYVYYVAPKPVLTPPVHAPIEVKTAPKHYFDTWSVGDQFSINVRSDLHTQEAENDIAAFMLISAYNRLTGRTGDEKLKHVSKGKITGPHEANGVED